MATFLLLAALLLPQGDVSATATINPAAGAPGIAVEVRVTLDVPMGWHVYHPDQNPGLGIPVSAKLLDGGGISATGPMKALTPAKPHVERIGSETMFYQWMEGKVQLSIPATISGSIGKLEGKVEVQWQVCNDKVCLPPETEVLPVSFQMLGAAFPVSETSEAENERSNEAALAFEQEAVGPGKEISASGARIGTHTRFAQAQVPSGGIVNLEITADVDFNWHLYAPEQDPEVPGIPFQVKVLSEGFEAAGDFKTLSKTEPHEEDFGGGMVFNYIWVSGEGKFELPVKVTAEPGAHSVEVELHWQVCDDSVCLDDEKHKVQIPIEVLAPLPGDSASTLGAITIGSYSNDFGSSQDEGGVISNAINKDAKAALDEGFWALMLAAMAAGFATLLTPCVFPMIPITVSFFTKRAEAGKGSAVGNASAYAFGIVLTFVGLGLGAGALLGATGANQIASSPWLNLGIAVLFIALAFSLLGFYEIQPPKFLQKFASEAQAGSASKKGYLPVILMAFAFSVTAFTCTVGFVGGLIALSATAGAAWYSLAAMTVYAIVFATPFFFLALFPNMLQKMPTAGGWMNAVKVSFGYIELIAAWKFLTSAERVWEMEILTRPWVVILTVIPLVLWAAYMFGLYTTKGDYGQKPPRTIPRMVIGALVLWAAVHIGMGYPRDHYDGWIEAYFPPSDYGYDEGPLGLEWHDSYQEAYAEGREKNQVVFLDFTGVTCVNCLRMEGNIFPADGVAEQIGSVVRAHLYVDKGEHGDDNGNYAVDFFGKASQPFYVIMDPFTEEKLSEFDGYDPDPERFAEFLKKGIDAGRQRGIGVN